MSQIISDFLESPWINIASMFAVVAITVITLLVIMFIYHFVMVKRIDFVSFPRLTFVGYVMIVFVILGWAYLISDIVVPKLADFGCTLCQSEPEPENVNVSTP